MTEAARLDAREWFAVRRLHDRNERTRLRAARMLHRILLRRAIDDAERSFGTYIDFAMPGLCLSGSRSMSPQ